jgi:hypothetical protein
MRIQINFEHLFISITVNESWIGTRQLGYEYNFGPQEGLNYWFDSILNPQKPASLYAKQNFRSNPYRGFQ